MIDQGIDLYKVDILIIFFILQFFDSLLCLILQLLKLRVRKLVTNVNHKILFKALELFFHSIYFTICYLIIYLLFLFFFRFSSLFLS